MAERTKSMSMPVSDAKKDAPKKDDLRVQTVRMPFELLQKVKIECATRDMSQQDLMILALCNEIGIKPDPYIAKA